MKYLPTTLSTILILVAVLIPGSDIPDVRIVEIDKLAHIILFIIWGTAVQYDFNKTKRMKWLPLFTIGLAFSSFTEVLQMFSEDRSFDFYDIAGDMLGLSLSLVYSHKLLQRLGLIP